MVVTVLVALVGFIFYANIRIETTTNDVVFDDPNNIPANKVGLLLGTSKYLKGGQQNRYYNHRISATDKLFQSGKIQYIVISGDNRKANYNEPRDMKNDLMKAGVPDSVIILDYAGFRTYDSVIRLNKIFGQNSFTVISQEFHNRRAIFIAQRLGLNAVGFNAEDVAIYCGFKTQLREKLARVKVFIDFLTNKEPKFLGDPIEIK
ncbi:MAG: YdcF family protein [Bacteroidales bacterium]|nr:YdcF family protein [Bacteroidales bacterium]